MKVYLDNAASTQVDEEVTKAMQKYLVKSYGNPSAIHYAGIEAEEAINEVRGIIAKKINCKPKEVIFTSGGTEANNLCIKSLKGHVVTSAIEHSSVLESCKDATCVKVDKDGLVNPKDVEKAIRKDTVLVSIMHANNEVGTIQNIEEIGKICKKKKVLFHTDAVQSFLKEKIDVKKMNIDMLSLSAHKVHGPKGVGVAYIRQGIKIKKLLDGGRHEFGLRAGTQNVPGIVGFGKAVENWKGDTKKLRGYMLKKLLEIPETRLNGSKDKRLSNNINISFKGLEGETILLHLSSLGVAVATGSACHQREIKVSHVLHAMGLSKEEAKGAIRITLSKYNTKKEVDYAISKIKTVIDSLRRLKE